MIAVLLERRRSRSGGAEAAQRRANSYGVSPPSEPSKWHNNCLALSEASLKVLPDDLPDGQPRNFHKVPSANQTILTHISVEVQHVHWKCILSSFVAPATEIDMNATTSKSNRRSP